MTKFDKQVNRNLKGKKLENSGKISQAIKLYETNIEEGFDGNHPYDRLAILYRKARMFDHEIRVLTKAVEVFESVVKRGRADGRPKLEKFKIRLEKAKALSKSNS